MEFNVLENSIIIFRTGELSPYMTNKGNWKTKFGSVLSILSLSVRAIILSDFSSQEVIFSCPGSDTLYFWVKAALPVKYPWITVIIKAGAIQKSLSNPITFPCFSQFHFLR